MRQLVSHLVPVLLVQARDQDELFHELGRVVGCKDHLGLASLAREIGVDVGLLVDPAEQHRHGDGAVELVRAVVLVKRYLLALDRLGCRGLLRILRVGSFERMCAHSWMVLLVWCFEGFAPLRVSASSKPRSGSYDGMPRA